MGIKETESPANQAPIAEDKYKTSEGHRSRMAAIHQGQEDAAALATENAEEKKTAFYDHREKVDAENAIADARKQTALDLEETKKAQRVAEAAAKAELAILRATNASAADLAEAQAVLVAAQAPAAQAQAEAAIKAVAIIAGLLLSLGLGFTFLTRR